ncbi:MAG TPA: Lrp/AsnC ligand binding domain-containing protein [Candidatus Acidoferrales bacterium]|nr:Lrp/AsnC ligand binding domain-containing protein [Candidatus Acidoferrales bacterium]
MQNYLVLIKTRPGKGGEFWEDFQKMPDQPMKGVTIESSWSLYGYWDFLLLFKADNNENSLHFIGEVLRNIRGIAKTSTSPMTVLKKHGKA